MSLLGILFGGWPPPPPPPNPSPPPAQTGSGGGTGSAGSSGGSTGSGGTSGSSGSGSTGSSGATGATTGSGTTGTGSASGTVGTAATGSANLVGTPVTAPAVRFDFGDAPVSEDMRARAYAIESLARERVASMIENLRKPSASTQLSLLDAPDEPKEAGGTYADSLKALGRQGEPVGAMLDKAA